MPPLIIVCVCVAGVHAVCDGGGWRVASGARPHVLQHQTRRKESTGKTPTMNILNGLF